MEPRDLWCSQKADPRDSKSTENASEKSPETEKVQKMLQKNPPSADNIERCKQVAADNRKEETYWHIRATMNELKDGDTNTTDFHYKVTSRRARNTIKCLQGLDGSWKTEEDEIERVITSYLEKMGFSQ